MTQVHRHTTVPGDLAHDRGAHHPGSVTWHSIEVATDAHADDVVGRLRHPRTGWLRPFLLLAVHAGSDGAAGDVQYRISDVRPDGDGVHFAGLVWLPRAGQAVFSSFSGRIVVRDRDDRVSLALHGDAVGGSDRINEGVLSRLVELLAGALAEVRANH